MKDKVLKYGCLAVLGVISIVLAIVVYRMFFMFDKKALKQYIFDAASTTEDPERAAQLITDSVQHILSSKDLTAQVKLLAEIDGIEKEKALALTALNHCYASGFIGKPLQITVQ